MSKTFRKPHPTTTCREHLQQKRHPLRIKRGRRVRAWRITSGSSTCFSSSTTDLSATSSTASTSALATTRANARARDVDHFNLTLRIHGRKMQEEDRKKEDEEDAKESSSIDVY